MKVIELNKGHVTIVDDEDFELLAQWRWYVHRNGYVARTVNFSDGEKRKAKTIYMAHEILPPKPGFQVDHKNTNKLDNRRLNLRYGTQQQQSFNRNVRKDSATQLRGVHPVPGGKFIARIKKDGVFRNLGTFEDKRDASAAYRNAALELHGGFARFN